MNSYISLDHLQVPQPCPKQWAELSGDSSKRYCSSCDHHVVDLSAHTRAEAERYLAKACRGGEEVCVFYRVSEIGKPIFRSRRSQIIAWTASMVSCLFVYAGCMTTHPVALQVAYDEYLTKLERSTMRMLRDSTTMDSAQLAWAREHNFGEGILGRLIYPEPISIDSFKKMWQKSIDPKRFE
jgi:hypothetical protein